MFKAVKIWETLNSSPKEPLFSYNILQILIIGPGKGYMIICRFL